MKTSICIIANGYPTPDNPEYAFLRPVVCGLADRGFACTVIAPQNITRVLMKLQKRRPETWEDQTDAGSTVTVHQPWMLSFSTLKLLGRDISTARRDAAVKRCIRKHRLHPELFYAHFWECGICAAKQAIAKGIPVVAASGESTIPVRRLYSRKQLERLLPAVKGVVCVSSKNEAESRALGLLTEGTPCIVLPNGYRAEDFHPADRAGVRSRLNLPQEAKIAVFVGDFVHRKGIDRVLAAAGRIPELKLLLIGAGEAPEPSPQILYAGRLPHSELSDYLNAADMFVLPTLREGCCNAIVEAMACGLPIISSDRDFNRDILDAAGAILIDPMDVDALEQAMRRLMTEDALRASMAAASLRKAQPLEIGRRVDAIADHIKEVLKHA